MIAAWFASGRVVDVILALVVLEAAALLAWHRRTGGGVAPRVLLPTLLAGGFLLVAMRLALADAPWPAVGAALLAGLLAHVMDLRGRWKPTIGK